METKYGFIVEAAETLEKMVEKEMPRLRRMELRRVIRGVNDVLEVFDEERQKLISEYGGEEGRVTQESEGWDEFVEEYNVLLNGKVEVDFQRLSPELLDVVPMSLREEQVLEIVGLVEPFDETD